MPSDVYTDPTMERKLGEIQVGKERITTVAFEAIRTEKCNRGPVTFTTVRINEGQGFLDNGTFIAPTDGVYQFEVSLIAYKISLFVMKTTRSNQMFSMKDSYCTRAYCSDTVERTVGKTAAVRMEKGDGIYVENQADRNSIRADITYPLTFKGFKIN